jgi:hypothetical protein
MPHVKTSWWVALALTLSAGAAGGAYAHATEPSAIEGGRATSGWGNPNPVPNPCSSPAEIGGTPVQQSRTMCGTARQNVMKVPGGSAIAAWSLGGNDRIYAKSGPADIHGGPGVDRAVVRSAREDQWGPDTEIVYDVNGRRLKQLRTPNGPVTDFDPSKVPLSEVRRTLTSARCWYVTGGDWYVRFADEPNLRAFNTIPGKVEFQKVAYRVGLYIWVADRNVWQRLRTKSWRWDETYDVDFPRFPGNFWRTFDTLERVFTRFNIPVGEPGYYRLGVAYYWYGTTQSYGGTTMRIPDYLKDEWVTTHFGLSNDKTARYSKDRYCAFGVDPQAGP